MEVMFDWLSIISIIGIAYGTLLAVIVLASRHSAGPAKKILGLLILSITFTITAAVMWNTHLYVKAPHLFGIFPQGYLLIGPFLYLYVVALTGRAFRLQPRHLLHFLPFFYFIADSIDFYSLSGPEKLHRYYRMLVAVDASVNVSTRELFIFLQLFVYGLLSLLRLRGVQRAMKSTCSEIEKVRLRWLYHLIFSVFVLLALYILFYSLRSVGGALFHQIGRTGITLAETGILIFLSYKGLIQPEIYLDRTQDGSTVKYRNSTLTKKQAKTYIIRLQAYIKAEKPYLNPTLTIRMLSEKSGIPIRHLSQVLNEYIGRNFFDYINMFRIQEAKTRLSHPDHRSDTILMIAYEVGFNSKSAFNSVFKKYAHMTPSQYRQRAATDR